MALGSTQLLTEISIRNPPGGKWWLVVKLTTSSTSVSRFSRKYGCLDFSQHYAPPWLVTGNTHLLTYTSVTNVNIFAQEYAPPHTHIRAQRRTHAHTQYDVSCSVEKVDFVVTLR
jgi:hypothetical protein